MNPLYAVAIYPIELAYKALFEFFVYCSGNFGFSLIALSLFTTMIYIPLRTLAANLHQREKQVSEVMAPQIAKIKAEKKGQERQAAINRLYRRYAYHPFLALRSSFGLLIQVPFLIAAYHLIRDFAPLAGQSFWIISDLSLPDSLLGPVNFLPILMTAVNLAAVYTTPAFTKRDTLQALFVAGLFLLLLYTSPAALLVYWTCNNTFTLLGNLLNLSKIVRNTETWVKNEALRLLKLANPLNVALSTLAAFGLFIYFPLLTYLRNVNEFSFNGPGLLVGLIVPCLVAFAGFYLILFLCEHRLKQYPAKFFSYSSQVTLVHIIILALLFAALIEGAFLSLGLPQLTGVANLFNSKTRLLGDSVFWIALIFVPLYFKKLIFRRMTFLMGLIFLFMLIGLGDAYTSKDVKEKVLLTTLEIRNKMAFNRDKNVIIIIADSFPTETAEEVFNNNPELAAKFDGFTLFSNNLGATSGATIFAAAQLLRGQAYDEGKFSDFFRACSTSPSSLVRTAESRGFNMYIDALNIPQFNVMRDKDIELSGSLIKFSYNNHEFKLFLFRFMPYIVKKLWNTDLSMAADVSADVSIAADNDNLKLLDPKVDPLYKDLVLAASRESARPALHFHMYRGVHLPFSKDKNGNPLPESEIYSQRGLLEASEWELKSFAQYLDFLKSSGLYDSSTVFFMGDHGVMDKANFSLFMVKPAGAAGALAYSQAPTSSLYLSELVATLDDSSENLPKWLENLPALRQITEPPRIYNVVSGTDRKNLKYEKKLIVQDTTPTRLVLGQQYSLRSTETDERKPLVVPSKRSNHNPDTGGGWLFYKPLPAYLSFQTDAKGRMVDVVILLARGPMKEDGGIAPPLNIWDMTSGNMVSADGMFYHGNHYAILRSVMLNENNEIALRISPAPNLAVVWYEIRLEEGGSIPFIDPEIKQGFLAKLDGMKNADKEFFLSVLSASENFNTGDMYKPYIYRQYDLNDFQKGGLKSLLTAPYVLAPIPPEKKDADTATGILSRLISEGRDLGAAYEPVGEPFVLASTLTVALYKKTRGFSSDELEAFIAKLPEAPIMSLEEILALATD